MGVVLETVIIKLTQLQLPAELSLAIISMIFISNVCLNVWNFIMVNFRDIKNESLPEGC